MVWFGWEAFGAANDSSSSTHHWPLRSDPIIKTLSPSERDRHGAARIRYQYFSLVTWFHQCICNLVRHAHVFLTRFTNRICNGQNGLAAEAVRRVPSRIISERDSHPRHFHAVTNCKPITFDRASLPDDARSQSSSHLSPILASLCSV